MTFSIVIPVYNGAAFLAPAIESATNQSVPADEVIVFVHDSSDESEAIAKQFASRVKVVVENTNLNIGQAWNRAMELTTSDYVVFLQADDLLTPDCVKHYREAVGTNHDVAMCFGQCQMIDQFSKRLPCPSHAHLPTNKDAFLKTYLSVGICVGTWGTLINRRVFDRCRFRTDIDFVLDHEWNFRMAFEGELLGIQKSVCLIRQHSNQTSKSPNKRYGQDSRRWFLTAETPRNATVEQRQLYEEFLLRLNADTAFYAFWNGQMAEKLCYVEFLAKHTRERHFFMNYAKYNLLRAMFALFVLKMFQHTGTFALSKLLGTGVRLIEDPRLYARIAWMRISRRVI